VAETTVKDLYAAGYEALVKRWDKCISVGREYVEKQCFPSRLEYHMFYVSMSICGLFTESPSYFVVQ
jgi:hypothetical protein